MNPRQIFAIYQTKLLHLAQEKAKAGEKVRFDPQGHVLVEISNAELIDSIKNESLAQPIEIDAFLKAYHISADPGQLTFCNLDVRGGDKVLEEAFNAWLTAGSTSSALSEATALLMQSQEGASIINLEEEMEMHMRLKAQGIKKIFEDAYINVDDWMKIQEEAAQAINAKIRMVLQDALLNSYEENAITKQKRINFKKLNSILDESRHYLAEEVCSDALIEACTKNITDFLPKLSQTIEALSKETYESLTAIYHDQFRTDARGHNQGITVANTCWIGRTKNTAHNKMLNTATEDFQAFRPILRGTYAKNRTNHQMEIDLGGDDFQVEARVPSIAVTENCTKQQSINDVKKKLKVDSKKMAKMVGKNPNEPVIYNLLTSNSYPLMDGGNRQVPSAKRILKGSHLFNKEQIEAGKPVWLVQNLAVNQHGKHLSYSGDPVTVEATIMAELAMLSTLNTNYSARPLNTLQNHYLEVYALYRQYAVDGSPEKAKYFHQSPEGQLAIQKMKAIKTNIKSGVISLGTIDPGDVKNAAANTLLKAFSTNQHWDLQYGMLLQSLSVFIQKASQYGCKSANERFQAVSNRACMLRSINNMKKLEKNHYDEQEIFLTENEKDVITKLMDYAEGTGKLSSVQAAVNKAYNTMNLYGPSTTVSFVDQGAGSKIKSRKRKGKLGLLDIDTNIGETDLDRLHNNVAWMQAHKGDYIGDIKRSAAKARGAKLREKLPASSQSEDIRQYYAEHCQEFYDQAKNLIEDPDWKNSWDEAQGVFGEKIYTSDDHPGIKIKVDEIAKIHTVHFSKLEGNIAKYGTNNETVVKLLDKDAYDGNKTEDIAAPGLLIIESIKAQLLPHLDQGHQANVLRALEIFRTHFIKRIKDHCFVDINQIRELRSTGNFQAINDQFADFEKIANQEIGDLIVQIGAVLAQNGMPGSSHEMIEAIKNAGIRHIEKSGRPNIIKAGFVDETEVVSAQFTRGLRTPPSSNRSRGILSEKLLSNHVIDFTGHIERKKIVGDLTIEGHSSNPPIDETDEIKRRYIAYKAALEEVKERAQDILSADPDMDSPIVIPLSTMMLLTPFAHKKVEEKIRRETEHGQVSDTKWGMEMLRHKKQPMKIEVIVEGVKKTIEVKLDISYMNLPVNVGENAVISDETLYNILLSDLQRNVNAQGMNDQFDNVMRFFKEPGHAPLREVSLLCNKLVFSAQAAELENFKNEHEEELQVLYDKLEKAMYKHCDETEHHRKGNEDKCKKIKNEILKIENEIYEKEKILHLQRQQVFTANQDSFKEAIQVLDTAIKAEDDMAEKEKLIFQKEFLLSQDLFYRHHIASSKYAYQFHIHYLRMNEHMNRCITAFCKSAEDRTGWLRVSLAAYTTFINQKERDPDLNNTEDRTIYDNLFAAKMHELSASVENTKYNSEARGLQVKEEFTCKTSNIRAGKLIAGLAKKPFKIKGLDTMINKVLSGQVEKFETSNANKTMDDVLKDYLEIAHLYQTNAAHAFYSMQESKTKHLAEIKTLYTALMAKLTSLKDLSYQQVLVRDNILAVLKNIKEKYLEAAPSEEVMHFSHQSKVIQCATEADLKAAIQKEIDSVIGPKNTRLAGVPDAQLVAQKHAVPTTDSFHEGNAARANRTKITTGKSYFKDSFNFLSIQREDKKNHNFVSDFYFDAKKAKKMGTEECLFVAITKMEEHIHASKNAEVISIHGDALPAKVVEYMMTYCALLKQKGTLSQDCINRTTHKIPKPDDKKIAALDKKISDASEPIYGVLKELGMRRKKQQELEEAAQRLKNENNDLDT